ncbi:GNAT family N-acetyltransferase [Isoptericola variabilis]|uniref:GCN5-related N-acetyltransferase n=1 Tax=Isoptericola variabilis (strain 225) TaxID=743718 RepID=F6FUA1_ISOV2|nr:GNAT family N-acetyltransferase [Isoptericola variabilis]AEG44229.1 GCN5-related N-acetyltransferase [Isoptericola variabilis 225]TWH28451.1 Sortase and related acyltransferases [Isoptericola variabilis J7]
MRAAVEVRPAVPDDLSAVADLAVAACEESPYGPQTAPADPERLREHLSVFVAAGGHVLVAVHDGAVCGLLLARVLSPHLFSTEPSLYVDAIYVAADVRRHGVGHALVGGAVGLATEACAPSVYCAPSPGARGMQRFLACLGFAPAAGHRVVSTATLQRRLASDVPASRPDVRREPRRDSRRQSTRAAIEDLIARRRRARAAGLPSGPLDLRALQARYGSERDDATSESVPS